MSTEYLIRKAKHKDIEDLIKLRSLLIDEGNGFYSTNNSDEKKSWKNAYSTWITQHINSNSPHIVVAEIKENNSLIIGCIIGIIDQRAPYPGALNGKIGWIQTMVIDPEFRRLGIANNLMKKMMQWFEENSVSKITLQTTPTAEQFYMKLGFVDSGEPLLMR